MRFYDSSLTSFCKVINFFDKVLKGYYILSLWNWAFFLISALIVSTFSSETLTISSAFYWWFCCAFSIWVCAFSLKFYCYWLYLLVCICIFLTASSRYPFSYCTLSCIWTTYVYYLPLLYCRVVSILAKSPSISYLSLFFSCWVYLLTCCNFYVMVVKSSLFILFIFKLIESK